MRDDAWFSGFADGEGSFKIDSENAPVFSLALRADDFAVLERLHLAFGGCVSLKRCNDPSRQNKPQHEWHVSGKAELRGLVEYFDRFPLRAKKARDYAIWRRAVSIYCGGSRGSRNHPELPVLRQALMNVRLFDPASLPVSPQLTLVLGDKAPMPSSADEGIEASA